MPTQPPIQTQPDEAPISSMEGASFVLTPVAPVDTPQNETGETVSIDFGRYIEAVRKRAWIVAVVLTVSVAAAAVYTARQPELYRSSATVIIDTTAAKVLTDVTEVVQMGTGSTWGNQGFFEKEYRILQSRDVARRAAELLSVTNDDQWTGLENLPETERASARAKLDPADFIHGQYTIEPDKSPNVVKIRTIGTDPERVAAIANAVAEAYLAHNIDRRVEGTREASTWLSAQNHELKGKLESSEDALYKFMEDNNVLNASLQSQISEVLDRLSSFNAKLAEVQAERIKKRLDAKALADVRDGRRELLDSIAEIRDAPVISALKTKLVELRSEKTELLARYLPAHPKVKAIDEQISTIEKDMEHEVNSILASLERQLDTLTSTESGLQAAIAAERQREARLNKLSLSYARLKRDVDTNSKLYDIVTTRMKEADLTGALRINNVSILERARVPQKPFRPVFAVNIGAAVVLGLLLGAAIPIGLDIIDNTVKTQADTEKVTQAPFLGVLPSIDSFRGRKLGPAEMRARDLFVANNPKSSSAECARFIRTNLLFMSPDRPLRTIMVTSAGPKEGKTTTAIGMASTMAESGSKTIIIDTDMRRPRLHRSFGVSNDAGLSSCIVNDTTLKESIQATDIPGLDILPCGPIPPNPAELLHTNRFSEIVEELKGIYDRVVFDSAPVGAVTDPVILGTQVDGTVLVVKCQKTTRPAAKQAIRSLRDANVNIFGVVLNDLDLTQRRYGSYYYQYYRRYGAYYGEGQDPAKESA